MDGKSRVTYEELLVTLLMFGTAVSLLVSG